MVTRICDVDVARSVDSDLTWLDKETKSRCTARDDAPTSVVWLRCCGLSPRGAWRLYRAHDQHHHEHRVYRPSVHLAARRRCRNRTRRGVERRAQHVHRATPDPLREENFSYQGSERLTAQVAEESLGAAAVTMIPICATVFARTTAKTSSPIQREEVSPGSRVVAAWAGRPMHPSRFG